MESDKNLGLLVGVDIGGTKVRVGLVNLDGEVIISIQEPVANESGEALAQQITRLVESVASKRNSGSSILGVGVAIPAVLDRTCGTIRLAPNIPKINGYPLYPVLEKSLRCPVIIEFDGLAGAAGEHWVGAGRDTREMAFIIVGTGVGAGFISEGRLLRGADGIAGCLGWSIVPVPGGGMTRLEDFCSGPGIAVRAQVAMMSEESVLRDLADATGGVLSARDVFMAARSGDSLASRLVGETIHVLGMGLANLVNITNPEMIVLGGSVGLNLSPDLKDLEDCIKQFAQPLAAQRVKLALSKLGQDFGVIGAARLVYSVAVANTDLKI